MSLSQYSSTPPRLPPKPSPGMPSRQGPAETIPTGPSVFSHQTPALSSWMPPTIISTGKTSSTLSTVLPDQALLSTLPLHPTEGNKTCIDLNTAVADRCSEIGSLAETVCRLEATLAARRAEVQQHLVEAKVLERQFRDEQAKRDAQLDVFGPRMLFRRVCVGVEEADRAVAEVEHRFLSGVTTTTTTTAAATTKVKGEGENDAGPVGEATSAGLEGESGATTTTTAATTTAAATTTGVATEREVAEFVRQIRDAAKTAFLRRQRKERWEEGRVGGWRY